ncbi:uncharacterized protein LOC143372368 isoform X2 [Andrena cerasifolii]
MSTGAIRVLDSCGLCNTYEATAPGRTSPKTALQMPDLETIIREFEMGYQSPTKQDTATEKNFVKKIVAAFEVKYKVYEDLNTAREAMKSRDSSNSDSRTTETPKRRSGVFSSPFKSVSDEFKRLGETGVSPASKESRGNERDANRRSGFFSTLSRNKLEDSNYSRRSGIFGTPCKTPSAEDRDQVNCSRAVEEGAKKEGRSSGIFFTPTKDKPEDSKSFRLSGIFSSPGNRSASKESNSSKSDIYTSPVDPNRKDSRNASPDSACIFNFDKEEPSEKLSCHFSPLKTSSLDETRTMDIIDLSSTLPEPEETIFFSGSNLPKTSTMINEIREEEANPDAAAGSRLDRTPKIVGAFLKKPIEVEDTSIDWIPITGKKLPRKRSLKQLLASLTGKRSLDKKSKMFSSERNLYEEPRELQDSGYDERSCSSSSFTSLVSITEALLQQENSYAEPERRSTLRTFRSCNSLNEEEDEAFYDAYPTIKKRCPKKLFLTEVPRQEVKLDLGPCYPPPPLKKLTMSLDRKAVPKKPHSPDPVYVQLEKVPKHPHLSKMRKHPFVSLTKMDDVADPCDQEEVVVIKNDLYEVEFRRSSENITSPAPCYSPPSTQNHYDVPRRFVSKSETEISQLCNTTGTGREQLPIYDVPRACPIERPRSCVYEDALSLRRRSAIMARPFFRFDTVMRVTELHYDILKPRSCRIYRNEAVVRSDSDLLTMEKRSSF